MRSNRWRSVLVAVMAAGAAVSACGAPGAGQSIGETQFDRQLPVPPLATGVENDAGRTVFTLRAQSGTTDFGQGGPADTIGINGNYLGPTLRMSDGEAVRMEVTNSLDEMTTLHWHGLHVPARMDGGPHQMVQPGTTWMPRWRVDQAAATLWYHSHPHGQTAQQVYRGMAGMLIVDDPTAPDVGLPTEYGVDDIPLIVQDKSFTSDGQLVVDPVGSASTGFLGDTIVTNGGVGTYLPVTTEAVRLRLLNASNARIYDFGFDDDRQLSIVASDGGLLAQAVPAHRVQLSPGERAEIVVRLSPGETATLNSTPPDLGTGLDSRFSAGTFGILQLRAADTLRPSPDLAPTLTTMPPVDVSPVATTRTFGVTGRAINGRPADMNRIDEVVTVGEPEIWEITNQDPQPHNFHVHNVQFRILSMGGKAPPAEFAGWKDTVYVAPRTTVRIRLEFTDYTNPNWPYMYHCHLLLHEDMGVMGQLVVVKPGQAAGSPPPYNGPGPLSPMGTQMHGSSPMAPGGHSPMG